MKRFWQLANIISLVFALIMNFLVGAQLLGLPAINDISDKYATLLTPAGYAFSIWSLIYVLLVVFVVYQARDLLKPDKSNDLPQRMGPFFTIASICNGLWTYIFVQEYIELSVAVLLVLTVSLYVLMHRLRIALDTAPFKLVACVWWPLLIYAGWVTVASVVNIASWLASIDASVSTLAACMALVVLAISLLVLLLKRNTRELALASGWGIVAIGVEQLSNNQAVAITAFAVSALLLLAIGSHAYHYRHSFFSSKQ